MMADRNRWSGALPGFDDFVHEHDKRRRTVFKHGRGEAVVLVHELPGMSPACIALAREISDAGFTVFLPLLFGKPNESVGNARSAGRIARFCISREFRMLAKHKQGRLAGWLRSLCRRAHQEAGGDGVGVIGMCLTGGFALYAVLEPKVLAAVASQPALPLTTLPIPGNAKRRSAIGISDQDLGKIAERTRGGLEVWGFRFTADPMCRKERFDRLEDCLGKDRFRRFEICSKEGNANGIPADAHSVFNRPYGQDDELHPKQKEARKELLDYLERQLKSEATPGASDAVV